MPRIFRTALCLVLAATCARAQNHATETTSTPAAETHPAEGTLLFNDGDRISNTNLRSVHGTYVTFSGSKGETSVDVAEIKDYTSTDTYAIFAKGAKLATEKPTVGKISIHDGKMFIILASGTPQPLDPDTIGELLDNSMYTAEMGKHRPLWKDWQARVGFGVSLERSTEDGTAINTEASADRTEPGISFLAERSRTHFSFTDEYERVTAPRYDADSPEFTEENTLHAEAERNQYFHQRFFMLGTYSFERNHSQGLLGENSYGVGLGWTVYKHESNEIVIKSDFDRRTQDYIEDTIDTQHYGQKVSQTLSFYLPHSLQVAESFDVDMAYADVHDISGRASAELRVPVYRNIGLEFSVSNDYLNDPSPGDDRNSYRFVTRITYTFQ